jgi:hypothetical protein
MGNIIDKVKEKITGAKDKVVNNTAAGTGGNEDITFEEGAAGTQVGRKDDPLTEYREKEAMTPAKEKEHDPTTVRRDPSDQKIVEPGQTGADSQEAAEKAIRSGMTKRTAGAAETGSEYEQGAAGSNK